jgi:hypothetical protein
VKRDRITVSEFGKMVDGYLKDVSDEDFLKAIRKAKRKVEGGGLDKYLREFSRALAKEEDYDDLWFTIPKQWSVGIKRSISLEGFVLTYPQEQLSPVAKIGLEYKEPSQMASEGHKIDRVSALSA